jgi:hypothetical protein
MSYRAYRVTADNRKVHYVVAKNLTAAVRVWEKDWSKTEPLKVECLGEILVPKDE